MTTRTPDAVATGAPDPAATPAPTAPPSPTLPSLTEVEPQPRTQYAMTAWLDYPARVVTVTQRMTYTNHTAGPLADLLLVVEPNRWPGAFSLEAMAWPDGAPVSGYALEGRRLTIPLPAPLAPGAARVLTMEYVLRPPDQRHTFGHTPLQILLADWHPFVPPHDGEAGWRVHDPAAIGEHLVYDLADFEFRVNVVGGGEAGVTVAASTALEPDGKWLAGRLAAARSFAWAASDNYEAIRDTSGPVAITSYYFAGHRDGAVAALGAAGRALEIFSELFGEIALRELAIVEADLNDGMEYDGLFFLDAPLYANFDGTAQNLLTIITVHEVAHQWWYASVGSDHALEPWLDEALSTYSERIYYERTAPELVNWWWSYRVLFFDPQGWVDSSIYDHGAFRPYVDAVYLRGALFLGRLRFLLGDEAFFAFLGRYARDNAGGRATGEGFWAALGEEESEEVRELVGEFFGTALPPR